MWRTFDSFQYLLFTCPEKVTAKKRMRHFFDTSVHKPWKVLVWFFIKKHQIILSVFSNPIKYRSSFFLVVVLFGQIENFCNWVAMIHRSTEGAHLSFIIPDDLVKMDFGQLHWNPTAVKSREIPPFKWEHLRNIFWCYVSLIVSNNMTKKILNSLIDFCAWSQWLNVLFLTSVTSRVYDYGKNWFSLKKRNHPNY